MILAAIVTTYLVFHAGATPLVVASLRLCSREPAWEDPIVPRITMHRTHDETVGLWSKQGPMTVRIRVWQQKGGNPLVLVEPIGQPSHPVLTGRAATYVHHCLFRGKQPDFIFCEHDRDQRQWSCVHFHMIRHCYIEDERHLIKRTDVEDLIGTPVES